MPTYTIKDDLDDHLPASLPAAITDAIKDKAIAKASSEIDGMLPKIGLGYGSGTQKFPDVTGDPATPVVIDECCQWLAAYRVYLKLKEINKNVEMKQGFLLRDMALKRLKRINDGDMAIYLSDGTQITNSSTGIYHTKANSAPRISRGNYDADGNLLDANPGTLDDFDQFLS